MSNKFSILFIFANLLTTSIFAQQVEQTLISKVQSKSDTSVFLFTEIFKSDSSLFNAFNNCDSITYKKYFTNDLEFYHDLGGLTVGLKNELKSFAEMCGRNSAIRRELVKGSMEVYPLKNFGAIEIGIHRFYHRNKGQQEKISGTYKFIHIWQKLDDRWKISRIISYGHDDMKND